MKLLLPTAYFPPISWMALAVKAQEIQLEQHETYPKQSVRNRCNILTANGLLALSQPLCKTRIDHDKTKDVEICENENWQFKHFRAIESAYNKSPFFYHYHPHFEAFYNKSFPSLIQFNQESIELIFKLLKMKSILNYTKEWELEPKGWRVMRNFFPKTGSNKLVLMPPYLQVFSDRFDFYPDLSSLDLLFNLGPEALRYLYSIDLHAIQDKQS